MQEPEGVSMCIRALVVGFTALTGDKALRYIVLTSLVSTRYLRVGSRDDSAFDSIPPARNAVYNATDLSRQGS